MKLLTILCNLYDSSKLCIVATIATLLPIIKNDVPFTSQFASSDWAEKVLRDGEPKESDPAWPDSGASSKEEYAYWVTTICGMACTVMALRFFTNKQYQTISLAKDAYEAGVYKPEDGHISHMHYRVYTQWVTKYGINATVYSRLTITGIRCILSRSGLVIASVNPNIRGYNTANPAKRGGHLVLVTGYDDTAQTITFHNPSGFVVDSSHSNHTLPIAQFQTFFAGRGIGLIHKNPV